MDWVVAHQSQQDSQTYSQEVKLWQWNGIWV